MDKDITNWQNLWKVEKSTPLDLSKLIKNLNKIEKKGKIERIIMLMTILITLIILTTLLPLLSNTNYLLSIVLISIGMIIILIQSYRSKSNFIINDAELNNQTYIKNLIQKLKQRMLTTSRYMWFYAFFLISGLNIGYINILQNFDITLIVRIIIHIVLTGVMFYLMYYFIEKRKKENNREILPLIDFLENLN
jgi:membrane protein implicated in regulation of membrane protease activity